MAQPRSFFTEHEQKITLNRQDLKHKNTVTILKVVTQAAGFDWLNVLEMKETNFVLKANRLLLVKCYNNKKVKSPYNWVISP